MKNQLIAWWNDTPQPFRHKWFVFLCTVLTFMISFLAAPLLCYGLRVGYWLRIWMQIITFLVLAVLLLGVFGNVKLRYVWRAFPIAIVLCILFAVPASKAWGIGLGGFGGFEYVRLSITVPLLITAGQFLALLCYYAVKAITRK